MNYRLRHFLTYTVLLGHPVTAVKIRVAFVANKMSSTAFAPTPNASTYRVARVNVSRNAATFAAESPTRPKRTACPVSTDASRTIEAVCVKTPTTFAWCASPKRCILFPAFYWTADTFSTSSAAKKFSRIVGTDRESLSASQSARFVRPRSIKRP